MPRIHERKQDRRAVRAIPEEENQVLKRVHEMTMKTPRKESETKPEHQGDVQDEHHKTPKHLEAHNDPSPKGINPKGMSPKWNTKMTKNEHDEHQEEKHSRVTTLRHHEGTLDSPRTPWPQARSQEHQKEEDEERK